MSEEIKEQSLKQDAQIKFEKLVEIVKDIEEKGNDGDHGARQIVLNAVVNSDNEMLYEKLEETLYDKSHCELMKTVITGLFLSKKKYIELSRYADTLLEDTFILDEKFEDKESLLLVADALAEATKSEDTDTRRICTATLLNLYQASCNQNSTAIIADKLLQRFINLLPRKSELIDNCLEELLKDENIDINSKLIAVDILVRSKPVEFFPNLEDIIINGHNYAHNTVDRLYLLDVSTKGINAIVSSGIKVEHRNVLNVLNSMKLEASHADEYISGILNRIKKRIKNLNDMINSYN